MSINEKLLTAKKLTLEIFRNAKDHGSAKLWSVNTSCCIVISLALYPGSLPAFRHGEEPGYKAKYFNDEEVVLPVHTLYIGGNSCNKM